MQLTFEESQEEERKQETNDLSNVLLIEYDKQAPKEEEKEHKSLQGINSAINRKRKLAPESESEISKTLKQIEATVESLGNTSEPKVHISLQPHRRYPKEMKMQALQLAEELGATNVSIKTGILESSIRRWKKVGVERLGLSGRRPQYIEVEKELIVKFKAERSRGTLITNQYLLT